jgi:hypothetical protein
MIISNQELVEEFYELNKHLYPGISLEDMKLCCNTPFLFVRKEMESGIKDYKGQVFLVHFLLILIGFVLIRMEEQFKSLTLSAKTYYFEKKAIIDKYLKMEHIKLDVLVVVIILMEW